MDRRTVPILLAADGLACLAAAVFAHALGLDPNPGWGFSRFALASAGGALLLVSALTVSKNKAAKWFVLLANSERIKTALALAHLWGAIFALYAWFVTFGNFTTWNHTSRYYALLADAFNKGQLHIDLDPGKALLEASDPYDPNGRAPFRDDLWDMSFYKGRLYYYWGPVPALLAAPIQRFFDSRITDNYLVYFFSAGLLIFNSLIVLRLWKFFHPGLAAWNAIAAIALVGVVSPIAWNTSVPYIYEAAVGAGQFFFMGGIYFALRGLERAPSFGAGHLFLAGSFFAAAVGSRAIYAPSVIFITLALFFWTIKRSRRSASLRAFGAFLAPLALGALAIGWYNWMRFDSPFEFGLRYQITTYNLNRQAGLIFRPDYFFLNLYAYLFQPFEFIAKFPFVQSVELSDVFAARGIAEPHLYYAGRITGIVFGSPFLLLGLVPLIEKSRPANAAGENESRLPLYRLTILLLAGSFLIGFTSLLFYFTAHARFLMDVVSPVALLAILGYWTIVSKGGRAKLWRAAAHGLILFTICASLLLAVSSETNRMETLNPPLFDKINSLFGQTR